MKKKFLTIFTLLSMLSVSFLLTSCNETTPNNTTSGDTTTTSATEQAQNTQTEDTQANQEQENIERPDQYKIGQEDLPQLHEPNANNPVAVIKTSLGEIKIQLFEDIVPITVGNFIGLAESGYYNGIKFHRVIDDFMLQTGDPEGTGRGGESFYGGKFDDEFSEQLYNIRGAVSMANSGANTNGSQFFIVQNKTLDGENGYYKNILDLLITDPENEEIRTFLTSVKQGLGYLGNGIPIPIAEKYVTDGGTPFLDYKHAVFGQVIEGMDVVDKIAAVEKEANESGEESRPVEEIIMESVTIIRN